jgi:hypothetical protein
MPRWYIFLPNVVSNWLQNGIYRDSMNYQDLFQSPFKEVHHESASGKARHPTRKEFVKAKRLRLGQCANQPIIAG